MKKTVLTLTALSIVAAGCRGEAIASVDDNLEARAPLASSEMAGLVQLAIPDEDPGPPFYARLGIQFYVDDGVLAIPFYRSPDCVPADFNLLRFFHFPGAEGPGAFQCPLNMGGFLLTEPDAPLGTSPRRVKLMGQDTPIWFVDAAAFDAAAGDGVVTMGELEALSPVKGVASRYAETLHPRQADHRVIIRARGEAEGRAFQFVVTDIQHDARQVSIIWNQRSR